MMRMSRTIPLERMTPEEIARLKLRYSNRDGSAEVLTSKAWAHIQLQDATIARLESELSDALTDLNTARQDNASFGPEFKRLKAEVERLREATRWRFLKDAPKDDTLVFWSLQNGETVVAPGKIGHLSTQERKQIYKTTGVWPSFSGYEPQLWMPLPKALTEEEKLELVLSDDEELTQEKTDV